MTEHTQEQRARWLEIVQRKTRGFHFDSSGVEVYQLGAEAYFSICAAITAEASARATAAERERCAKQDDELAETQRMLIRNLRVRGSGGVDTAITDCQMQLNAYETSAAAHREGEE